MSRIQRIGRLCTVRRTFSLDLVYVVGVERLRDEDRIVRAMWEKAWRVPFELSQPE